jgi:hypothetical protein
MKLGLSIGYSGAELKLPVDKVLLAEKLGFDSVWTAEAYGSDAITPLAYLAAQRADLCRHRLDRRLVGAAVHHHRGPVLRQPQRDGAADVAPGPGHQGHLAVEASRHPVHSRPAALVAGRHPLAIRAAPRQPARQEGRLPGKEPQG